MSVSNYSLAEIHQGMQGIFNAVYQKAYQKKALYKREELFATANAFKSALEQMKESEKSESYEKAIIKVDLSLWVLRGEDGLAGRAYATNEIFMVMVQKCECEYLNLSCQLTDLPSCFAGCKQLVHLDLSNNPFKEISSELAKLAPLENLKTLDISRCNITSESLSAVIEQLLPLKSLTDLHLCNNTMIDSLPKNIIKLTHLEVLNLYGNSLSSLPAEIDQLSRLTLLNLSYNSPLQELPESLKKISGRLKIEIEGTSLPEEIERERAHLESLPPGLLESMSPNPWTFVDCDDCEERNKLSREYEKALENLLSENQFLKES